MASSTSLTERLKQSLPYCSTAHAAPLHHRLTRCGDPDEWNGHFTCRTPGCDACRGRYIASQRRAALKRFSAAQNCDLALVSVVIGATAEVSDIGEVFQKFRKDVRNMMDAQRRQRRQWRGVELLMWLETDAFAAEDYLYLGSDKRAQLGELVPMFVNRQGPVWVVTAHGLAHLNGLEPQQIRDALQERWAGTKQVDVRPLYDHRTVSQNVGSIVNYALKHECRVHLGGFSDRWPAHWVAEYYAYLHGWSRGFQSMRINIGQAAATKLPIPAMNIVEEEFRDEFEDIEPLPFACSYSIFPTY